MCNEITKNSTTPKKLHPIPAGIMPTDDNVELFADPKTQRVLFSQNGSTFDFARLSVRYKNKLLKKLLGDPIAKEDLKHHALSEALMRFAYCVYGNLDHQPDITATGLVGVSDSYICGIEGCNCQNWHSKRVFVNGKELKGKPLQVLLAYRNGREDRHVSEELNITASTLNTHKKALFELFGVHSKSELILAGIHQNILN